MLEGLAGTPVLLVNPGIPLSTAEVFAAWDGVDRGPLGDWQAGRNDLEAAGAGGSCRRSATVLDALGRRPHRPHVGIGRDLLRPVRFGGRTGFGRRPGSRRPSGLVGVPNQASLTRRSRSGTGLRAR